MTTKLNIGEDLQHPAWLGNVRDVPIAPGLKFMDQKSSGDRVVKLRFQRNGEANFGSGFFVNIPDATHDVILTAGHNLIDPNGNMSEHLTLQHPNDIPIPISDVRVSAAYKANQKPATDYGAILLPKTSPGKGFGFSLKFAYETSRKGDVNVSGYRVPTLPGQPITSSGACVGCYADQLEYKAETEQGISGSPVWVGDLGGSEQTVIAIHNHRPARVGGGSRGSRLTPKLLREVFGWVGVGEYGVKLGAKDTTKGSATTLPPRGLFLSFSEDFPFARVRLGSGTAFDVLPAQVTSEKVQYAMAVGGKWAMFNTAKKEVVLSDKITTGCLFTKSNVKVKKRVLRVVVETVGGNYQLRVQGKRIREFDGEYAESSEVSMVEYGRQNDELFTEFWFE
ncbi:hypothetical protein JB92DRAFT_3113324 [Gautieria morchelliformis]|nr:hypothetical protein JB92DRAFT_3113324 [Gautieria morchelliformis]